MSKPRNTINKYGDHRCFVRYTKKIVRAINAVQIQLKRTSRLYVVRNFAQQGY